ncbi:MAG: pseudouridine-5-phosphate glycosidase [Propionibacteriales bacterium]|nr:pseudouridine-5-phosphate glycosidase [Propionibacteriales bacterium]
MSDEVADALAEGRGVVALESTIISHGLDSGHSAEVARRIEAQVRAGGAVPATIAVADGAVRVGLDDGLLERVATESGVVKASIRDLSPVLAGGGLGATTVASTSLLAWRAGIRVFATGGLGGVHRNAGETWDESADLPALASAPTTVVCAGVKSILDVRATLERLETLSVAVLGYRTRSFPGFYVRESGYDVPWTVDDPDQVAEIMRMRDRLGLRQALVVANPISEDAEMDRRLHDETLSDALEAMAAAGASGKDVTPFLLAYFHEHTRGTSLRSNVQLVLANAELAGRIAHAHARTASTPR